MDISFAFIDPLTLSAIASIAVPAVSALFDRQPKFNAPQQPEFDFGAQQQALLSGIGSNVAATGRSAQKSLQAQGLGDSSVGFGVQQGIAGQGMQAQQQGLANLEALKNQALQQQFQNSMRIAQQQYGAAQQQPGVGDYLGLGLQTFGSLYPMLNPEAFTPQFNFGG